MNINHPMNRTRGYVCFWYFEAMAVLGTHG